MSPEDAEELEESIFITNEKFNHFGLRGLMENIIPWLESGAFVIDALSYLGNSDSKLN
jgi:hypothetical protein